MNKNWKIGIIKIGLFLTMSLLVIGCCYKNDVEIVQGANNNEDVSFKGIVDIIDENEKVNIMFVHGMGGYAVTDNTPDSCKVMYEVKKHINTLNIQEFWDVDKKKLRSCSASLDDYNGEPKKVLIRAIDWSQVTIFRKWDLMDYDEESVLESYRANTTKNIKRDLINYNLADVVMYVGEQRNKITSSVMESMSNINRKNPNAKNVFITFSLGSAVVLDILEHAQNPKEYINYLKQKNISFSNLDEDNIQKQLSLLNSIDIDMIYMMANQIPLLKTGTSKDKLQNMYKPFSKYFTSKEGIRLVAFSDPNDILSYALCEECLEDDLKDKYANVAISIADKTYHIPFYKNLDFVNYMTAHLGYVHNDNVLTILMKGR